MKWYPLVIIASILFGCTNKKRGTQLEDADEGMIKTASGLKYIILKKGSGPAAAVGQEVLIYETTSYLNGTVLYSNENTNNPVKVLIGGHLATEGVDEGLRGYASWRNKKINFAPLSK